MLSQNSESLLLSDLQNVAPEDNKWFDEQSPIAMAGRCLLDVLEYVRANPNVPGRFDQVTKAHAIRLTCRCLSELEQPQMLQRLKPRILEMARQLRASRQNKVPYYGDDFWDWAVVLSAFGDVQAQFPNLVIDETKLMQELKSFYSNVTARLGKGLTIPANRGEWYGPATAVLAYRIIERFRDRFGADVDKVLGTLRAHALELIENGKYRGEDVERWHVIWHYGQVVAQFSLKQDSEQARQIANLSGIEKLERAEQVYALARALQGARETADLETFNNAIEKLYDCQNTSRPLGQGLLGDTVKGSLNVLEALWPVLDAGDKTQIVAMIDALRQLYAAANTVGVVVAIPREAEAIEKAFRQAEANVKVTGKHTIIEHAAYRVVVGQGKSLISVFEATRKLVDEHKVKWVIMSGIAGSLGTSVPAKAKGVQFIGPDLGDVVVAAALAPFRIRDKFRQTIQNAKVPFEGSAWMMIPTDTGLFALAHKAGDELYGDSARFYEGLIVSGTGIKDSRKAKAEMLAQFPGGLAVEEEGYAMGILCMARGVPYLNIRGISDRAEGDKKKQNKKVERDKQVAAASAAARLTVRIVELMSQQW
jgi:nucleoside phosphorylase